MVERSQVQAHQEKTAQVESEWIHRGKYINVRVDTMTFNHGSVRKWDIIEHPGAVAIIPVTADGHILLVKQWRRSIHEIILEIPAGTLEGEAPAICAQRELQEEVGYKAHRLISLGGFYSAPGFCNEYLHLFLALNLEKSALPPDEDEGIDVVSVTLDEALQMIDDYKIRDAKSVAGILRYERWKRINPV